MIPKKIHCIWFGGKPFPALEKKCIESWYKYLPDYDIIYWNENNYHNDDPVFNKALKEKKWAFCADIARLDILYKHGGVYLDTDMEIIKSLDDFLMKDFFIGKESEKFLSCGIIGSPSGHPFVKDSLDEVIISMQKDFVPIPKIMTYIFERNKEKYNNIAIYNSDYFYPYNPFARETKVLLYSDITKNTHAIHHWNYSWKPGLIDRVISKLKRISRTNKFLKRLFGNKG